MKVKPFLKWTGGKSQLINDISNNYPNGLGEDINKYCEPFVGGGAILFNIISNYTMKEILINDTNTALINVYNCIKYNIDIMIMKLLELEYEFNTINDMILKQNYYINKRQEFNNMISDKTYNTDNACLFIFLNKTCFNGLYRVNSNGLFNVPFGKYNKINLCDIENIKNISELLQNIKITNKSYNECFNFIDKSTFVYIDPPYRPLNKTSSFNSYTKNKFGDKQQIELHDFINKINIKNAKILLSNSDPKNTNINDNFFDELYYEYNIKRVNVKRMINSNSSLRNKKLTELLISNY